MFSGSELHMFAPNEQILGINIKIVFFASWILENDEIFLSQSLDLGHFNS